MKKQLKKYFRNEDIIYLKQSKNNEKRKNLIKSIFFIILFLINFTFNRKKILTKQLKIGVIGVRHEINVGNNLIKYAITIILKEMGFIPYIIGTRWKDYNISFLNATTNLRVIKKNFTEIKKDDYDILIVNSDQTWRKFDKHFLDYGFLKFAENWNIKKIVYGASLGYNYWRLSLKDEKIAKKLLKNFTGISIREQGSLDLVKKHFGINPEIVLDPTLLIDKKYYLNLFKNIRNNNESYIFVYKVYDIKKLNDFILKSSNELNYKVYEYKLNNRNKIEDFLYYISNSKAVITNSFHGTIFSIIFNF